MTISIITINYHSQKYLPGFLSSLHAQIISHPENAFSYEIIIVNNEETPLVLAEAAPVNLTVINAGKNIGFGAANNLAAKQAKGELLFFLNPDVELKDESLLKMFDYLTKHPEVSIIGPKIMLSKPSRPQPWTCGKKVSLLDILFRNSIGKPWNKHKITTVDWVSGTALLIKKDNFFQLDGFDEKFFMYFEDQDLCLRLKKFGKSVVFFPEASIVHFDGKSWNNFKHKKIIFLHLPELFFSQTSWPV